MSSKAQNGCRESPVPNRKIPSGMETGQENPRPECRSINTFKFGDLSAKSEWGSFHTMAADVAGVRREHSLKT